MKGFFESQAPAPRVSLSLIPHCGACGLYKTCNSPKMEVAGRGRKKILVVGEAPGKDEDALGEPFVGASGRFLADALNEAGVDLKWDCWVTNSVVCRPPSNDLKKHPKAVDYCRPNVVNAVRDLKPEKILLFGSAAVKSVLGWLTGESDPGGVERWAGWVIPCQEPNAWITINYHPAHILRSQEDSPLPVMFRNYLKAALKPRGRPWKELPNFSGRVMKILDEHRAAKAVKSYIDLRKPTAFDFETDRLKPDHPDSLIRCCALSNGLSTVAFPWHGAAVRAMKEFLASDTPKIGFSAKFESRWSRRHLNVWPRNWVWDGMLAAHALDNRRGVCGLDFQAFALLGQPPWDAQVAPYLKTRKEGGNEVNRVRDCDLNRLLQYCGLDALLELEVAKIQAKQMGVSF